MVRAAAKNHAHVGVVVDPPTTSGCSTSARRRALGSALRAASPVTAFAHTAAYDAAIVTWFDETTRPMSDVPATVDPPRARARQPLRYGENPHQQGARYRQAGATSWWDSMTQHGGKELSYLNVFDTEAAWRLVHRFDEPRA
jgi:phosphoribosylaminoimidazolecarboxamide formyltransferase / IMP cyclohydrolase